MKDKRKVYLVERLSHTNGWEIVNLANSIQHWPNSETRCYLNRTDAKKAMDYYRDTQCATSWKFRVVTYTPGK